MYQSPITLAVTQAAERNAGRVTQCTVIPHLTNVLLLPITHAQNPTPSTIATTKKAINSSLISSQNNKQPTYLHNKRVTRQHGARR